MNASLFVLIVVVGLVAADCPPKQEDVNGECKKKCKAGFTRNAGGDCRKNCMDNAMDNGDGKCKCNEGFDKYKGECLPPCGENMRRKTGTCICKLGFVLESDVCVPKGCPTNEELRGSKCYCVEGTKRVKGECVGDCAENMRRMNGICQCRKNFEMYNSKCVDKCGRNSARDDSGVCVCLLGFEDTNGNGNCKQIVCTGKNEVLDGNDCKCDEGFVKQDGVCVEPIGPEPPEPEPAPPGCFYKKKGHRGHDISWGFGSNTADCVQKCEDNDGCLGSTFDVANLCWLHHNIELDRYYDACDDCSLYVKDCDDAANPVPDFPMICPENANCDSGVAVCDAGYQMVDGACEKAGCLYRQKGHRGHDFEGTGFASNERECIEECQQNDGCRGSTFDVADKCWLHHTIELDRYYDACDKCTLFIKECYDSSNPVPEYGCPAHATCDGATITCDQGYRQIDDQCVIEGCEYERRGHRGHDMMSGFDSTSDGCLVQCANDLTCQGSTFDVNNKCWLHFKVERTRYYDACDTCTLYVKNCQAGGCRYLGRGHAGNDIGTGVPSNADACVQSCQDNDACVGSTFDVHNKCWQHHAIGYDRFYPACDGCELFLKECTSAAYGCEYRKRGHRGNDIGTGVPSTAEDCAAACVANNACKGSTFDVNNKCWQHHDIGSNLFYDACDDCTLFLKDCNNAARG